MIMYIGYTIGVTRVNKKLKMLLSFFFFFKKLRVAIILVSESTTILELLQIFTSTK